MDFSFHISHATLGPPEGGSFTSGLVAVHAVVEDTDYILCYLGKLPNSEIPVLQQPLNLEISDGEEITLYMDCISHEKNSLNTVFLTGYITDFLNTVGSDAEDDQDMVLENSSSPALVNKEK